MSFLKKKLAINKWFINAKKFSRNGNIKSMMAEKMQNILK